MVDLISASTTDDERQTMIIIDGSKDIYKSLLTVMTVDRSNYGSRSRLTVDDDPNRTIIDPFHRTLSTSSFNRYFYP